MPSNTVLLTGGHGATTAISVIEEIKRKNSEWHLYWVGPKSAVEGKYIPTLASSVMPKLGVKFGLIYRVLISFDFFPKLQIDSPSQL